MAVGRLLKIFLQSQPVVAPCHVVSDLRHRSEVTALMSSKVRAGAYDDGVHNPFLPTVGTLPVKEEPALFPHEDGQRITYVKRMLNGQ